MVEFRVRGPGHYETDRLIVWA